MALAVLWLLGELQLAALLLEVDVRDPLALRLERVAARTTHATLSTRTHRLGEPAVLA